MIKKSFSWQDIEAECSIETHCFHVEKPLGARITVPEKLQTHYPYNASVYNFLYFLKDEIKQLGYLHFPKLCFNKTNYTLAQGAPQEHSYSSNPFMTSWFQEPHQDTPPHPTAFGLETERKFFATWLLGPKYLQRFFFLQSQGCDIESIHRELVPESIATGDALLINTSPGLSIIDNSDYHPLYHARTCQIEAVTQNPNFTSDSKMYAFNEIGLLYYIDQMDSKRGQVFRDDKERLIVSKRISRLSLN